MCLNLRRWCPVRESSPWFHADGPCICGSPELRTRARLHDPALCSLNEEQDSVASLPLKPAATTRGGRTMMSTHPDEFGRAMTSESRPYGERRPTASPRPLLQVVSSRSLIVAQNTKEATYGGGCQCGSTGTTHVSSNRTPAA